jgi:hypothetical protein
MNTPQTVIVPGTNVEGNITSCKIENQLISTQRSSALSVTETNTYASYDVCSKEIISQYSVPQVTELGELGLVIVLSAILFAWWFSR